MKLFRILDPFTLTLITVVLLASFFPARGDFVPFFENLTTAAMPCCSLCTARSCRVRRLLLAVVTGDCICG
ncbi:sodium/bile acid symporter family (mazG-like) [Escherichia coli]|uniref:Sodium/bile acid symporter family (MazG-like) n=1 Tax=Escherichia coli TaxID=562 RepID=A0A376REW4_ECOLX|nr:sodium/bile acid symporter family (mazG-like) [Escherichia coli]